MICVLLPRYALAVAAGEREALLREPVALAPEPGREQFVGEVSAAAEAFGVRDRMRLGEALARCPELRLLASDPAGVAESWERLLGRLELIGAAVAPERPGLAYFETRGLLGLHGGIGGIVAAARRTLAPRAVRIGAAPSAFCALAAAGRARPRRAEIVDGDAAAARVFLSSEPIALLRVRESTAALVEPLSRLGVRTLGELAELDHAALADRFGAAGLEALRLAGGRDAPLRPRVPGERLQERLELPEAISGPQLERALELLVDRLLSRLERRGRTLRAVVLSATLVEGGTWRVRRSFREALADPARMRLALAPRLSELPAPAEALALSVERFGPPAGDQRALLDDDAAQRDGRLREGVRQARVAAGPDAALRVLALDPDSRVPERRVVLAPYDPS